MEFRAIIYWNDFGFRLNFFFLNTILTFNRIAFVLLSSCTNVFLLIYSDMCVRSEFRVKGIRAQEISCWECWNRKCNEFLFFVVFWIIMNKAFACHSVNVTLKFLRFSFFRSHKWWMAIVNESISLFFLLLLLKGTRPKK